MTIHKLVDAHKSLDRLTPCTLCIEIMPRTPSRLGNESFFAADPDLFPTVARLMWRI